MLILDTPRLDLGRLVITPEALQTLSPDEITLALRRHVSGDWGEVGVEDKVANDQALESGARILSAYLTTKGERFWILTEAGRYATSILLPHEY